MQSMLSIVRVKSNWRIWSADNRNLFLISSVTEADIYGSSESEFVVCFIHVVTAIISYAFILFRGVSIELHLTLLICVKAFDASWENTLKNLRSLPSN